jgi:hypothetical protein
MRTQAVAPQFRETFETSSVSANKGATSENDFATVLHRASEGVTPAPARPSVTADEQETARGEEAAHVQEQNASLHSKRVQAAIAQPSTHESLTLERSTDPVSSSQAATTEGLSADVSKGSVIPLADDSAGPINEATACSSAALPQGSLIFVSDLKDQSLGSRMAATPVDNIADGKLAKSTLVDGAGGATKVSVSNAKAASDKSTIEERGAQDITNWSGTNPAPDLTAGGAAPQAIVTLQSQAVAPAASLTASNTSQPATGASNAAGYSSMGQPSEIATDRKTGVRAVNEAITTKKAVVEDDVPPDAADDPVPAGAIVGVSAHNTLAVCAVPSAATLSGDHPVESRVVSAPPLNHGLAFEAAGSLMMADPQSVPSATGMLPHALLNSSATSLEVGVASGTHGWVKVRAEMTGNGAVNASLTGGSSIAANRLREDLPALSSYLQAEKVQVNGLNVHMVLPGAAAFSSETISSNMSSDRSGYDGSGVLAGSADGGAAGGRSQQQDGQGTSGVPIPIGSEDALETQPDRTSDLAMFEHGVGLGGKVNLPSVEYGIGGGWLNVRA